MARTSRNGAPAAPAMDAGALDDLDLDDMFAEDGDTLFEGLDIQLDGMGDIISDEQKEQKEQKAEKKVDTPPKRSAGTKTKKSNQLVEEPPDPEVPKRRKTKRKSKAPTAFGDEDEDYIEDLQPKKKQRKAAANRKAAPAPAPPPPPPPVQTKKKKTKKGEVVQSAHNASPPAKGKKVSGTLPAPVVLSRGTSTTVAAAGQFGGRLKRGAILPTNKVKRKLKGLPTSAPPTAASASEPAPAPAPSIPSVASLPVKPPKQESTYGGLAPSKTHFYPFMEAVPAEPSMKNRKVYPILDKISSNLSSQLNAAPPEEPVTEVTMDSPIFKLLLETYEGASEKERASFTQEKRVALLNAIPNLRKTIHNLEKSRLVADLYAMCGLLSRQHSFLKQSLQNMKEWCQKEFTPSDFQATYAKPTPKDLQPQPTDTKSDPTKWKSTFIKVKVVCSAFKEPKGAPPLTAMMPPHVVIAPPPKPAPTVTTKKKKKEKTAEKPKVTPTAAPTAASTPVPAPSPTPAVKPYQDCTPLERRQRIAETVSQLALQLEEQEIKSQTTQKPPESLPDEEPPLHTARMWQWLDSTGFYNSLPPNGLDMQSPEIHPRGLFLKNPTKIQGHDDRVDEISSNSLFDRLQSLLVEVDRDDENSTGDSDGSDGDDESLGFLDDDDAQSNSSEMADLSQLSLEERTFIVLRSVGLIQDSVFPMAELVLSSNEDEKKVRAEDDLVNVIGEMSTDLSQLTRRNNARFAYLESTLSTSDKLSNKHTEEEQASVIAKCQNLLRRSKEKAKKIKQKKDDNLNLPW